MIYQTVTANDFIRAFDEAGRSDNFSVNARRELFHYYSELSDVSGEDIELDPIAICCDWTEYTDRDLLNQYSDQPAPRDNPARCEEEASELAEDLSLVGTLIVVEHIGEPDTYLFCE